MRTDFAYFERSAYLAGELAQSCEWFGEGDAAEALWAAGNLFAAHAQALRPCLAVQILEAQRSAVVLSQLTRTRLELAP